MKRRSTALRPGGEGLETRRLLTSGWPSYLSPAELRSLLNEPLGYPVVRPNTPVLPFGVAARDATYIDPSACVTNGYAVIVGTRSFIGPYAKLNATDGVVKIGGGTTILDNASITANPTHTKGAAVPEVRIGDGVEVGYGAVVTGPAVIGGFGAASQPTSIGAGAVIDDATIEPGAFVSSQARVGPGVTVPAGMRVLAGANVTTNAEATDPALGKVTPVTEADLAEFGRSITANLQLGVGYITLYQGQSSTGVSPGSLPSRAGIFNGNLSTILGSNVQPGPPATFLPPGTAPKYPTPHRGLAQGVLVGFPARATGNASFLQRARFVASNVGRRNAIRADQGQPITIGSIARTGYGVTLNAPNGGSLAIGQRFIAGDGAVILGGATGTNSVIGDDVNVGAGAVVQGSSLGAGSTVGPLAYLVNSSFPDGTHIPAGAIYVDNALVGQVGR
ncbi:carbonic anhydrase/acetyltransferase [Planctomyces sp. SH-PL62]|uniref:carbonic anhydrase/acetyltransferase n=1 Tax=Planctomyces sp. SH-PL62 TaxID=1636152 RepID=UPI0012E7878E|nr:carbonic anhydrase/acetyltransferase [Planctomyces sp. SH-PL62]